MVSGHYLLWTIWPVSVNKRPKTQNHTFQAFYEISNNSFKKWFRELKFGQVIQNDIVYYLCLLTISEIIGVFRQNFGHFCQIFFETAKFSKIFKKSKIWNPKFSMKLFRITWPNFSSLSHLSRKLLRMSQNTRKSRFFVFHSKLE